MVRAVVLVAQDRMTGRLSTFPRSSPERRRRDEEERRQRVMVITEFAAGDPEATMHALADEKRHESMIILILTLIAVVLLASCANPAPLRSAAPAAA